MKKKTIFSLFLFAAPVLAEAGELTPLEVLKEMNKRYLEANSYSMNIEVEIFDNTISGKPVQTFKGNACKSGSNYFSKMMGQTSISNERCLLLVDENQKIIQYSSNVKKTKLPVKDFDVLALLDSLPGNFKSIKFITAQTGGYSIQFETNESDPYYKNFTIEVDRSTFAFRGITYLLKNEQSSPYDKIAVHFTNTQFNQPVSQEVFSENKYVAKSKGKIIAAGGYATYQVINQEDFKTAIDQ